jgi:hypothetical protein
MDRLRANVGTRGPCVDPTYATQHLEGVLTGHERPPERRSTQRFLIERDVRYRVVGVDAFSCGKTVNISSRGMLLAVDRVLSTGLLVEVEIDWPVKLADQVSLKLVIVGQIVRSTNNDVALAGVKISRYKFRTAGNPSDPIRPLSRRIIRGASSSCALAQNDQ